MSDDKTVAIENIDIAEFRNILESKGGNELYHIGIIDYLGKWDFIKKGEAAWKSKCMGKNKDEISAVEPNLYCNRFKKTMKETVFGSKNIKDYKWLFSLSNFEKSRNTVAMEDASSFGEFPNPNASATQPLIPVISVST